MREVDRRPRRMTAAEEGPPHASLIAGQLTAVREASRRRGERAGGPETAPRASVNRTHSH